MDIRNSLYSTIHNSNYYDILLNDYISCRSSVSNRLVFQLRDRGDKFDWVWDYNYVLNQSESFKNRHSNETSFFKTWLELRMNPLFISCYEEISTMLKSLNCYDILRVAKHNYLECYGISMLLFEIINRVFFCNEIRRERGDNKINPYQFVRLSALYSLTYLKYHSDRDNLKSVDILSNYARMSDVFQEDYIAVLFDVPQPNAAYRFYSYIWAMEYCFKVLPMHMPFKLNYHTCARMMYQNQTVGGVTEDSLETPYSDCIQLGEVVSNSILSVYEETMESNGELIEPSLYNSKISEMLSKIVANEITNANFGNMQYINKVWQIEAFDGATLIRPEYRSAPIHYSCLIQNMGFSKEYIDDLEVMPCDDRLPNMAFKVYVSEQIMEKTINYSDETYCKLHQINKTDEIPRFRDLVLILDNNHNLSYIGLTGSHLYAIKKDIDWTNHFYGIPCIITSYDFTNRLYEDRLQIAVFGNSQSVDEFLFDKRFSY